MKINAKKTQQKSFSKKQIFHIVKLIGVLLLIFVIWNISVSMYFLQTNPARTLAQIMPSFAKQHQLEKIDEYNGAVGVFGSVNGTPFYTYIYQGDQSLDEMKGLLEDYLTKNGYNVKIKREADKEGKSIVGDSGEIEHYEINNGYPFWRIDSIDDRVSGIILDHDKNSPGKTRVSITFTSNSQ